MMKNSHGLFILLVIIATLTYKTYCALQLVQAQVVTRHGDRLPISLINSKYLLNYTWSCNPVVKYESEFYPSAGPNRNSDRIFYKHYYMTQAPGADCALGSLTFTGVQQHFYLGQRLRERYITNSSVSFLNKDKLDTTQVLIESSDIPRTIQSAYSLWQGMYPSAGESVTMFLSETTVSDMYPNTDTCPRLNEITKKIQESEEYQHHFQSVIMPLLKTFGDILEVPSIVSKPSALYDMFACRFAHGVPNPPGVSDKMVQELFAAGDWLWKQNMDYSKPLSREYLGLGIGPLMMTILNRMKDLISGQKDHWKFVHYSGHDSTIAPLIALLNISDYKIPPYASHLAFDLYQDDASGEYYVNVIYNYKQFVLPGCKAYCPLKWFENKIKEVVPSDIMGECKQHHFKGEVIVPANE